MRMDSGRMLNDLGAMRNGLESAIVQNEKFIAIVDKLVEMVEYSKLLKQHVRLELDMTHLSSYRSAMAEFKVSGRGRALVAKNGRVLPALQEAYTAIDEYVSSVLAPR
ncbi:MAG: hypothetical protein Q8R04_02240 [Nanoarchaeota archaeon]|nr:hypothetical protein [Nanoarchaeota archaeon]